MGSLVTAIKMETKNRLRMAAMLFPIPSANCLDHGTFFKFYATILSSGASVAPSYQVRITAMLVLLMEENQKVQM
jgi:hypothetical protein